MNGNLVYIKEILKDNFDVKYRYIRINGDRATIIFIDDMCDSKFISEFIIAPLVKFDEFINDADIIKEKVLYASSVGDAKSRDDAVSRLMSGDVIIVFDKLNDIIYCEAKGFAKRSVTTPQTEAVLKGPKEGFTESFADNVSMLRRRIKNTTLKFENMKIGKNSETTLVLCYIEEIVPQDLLQYVKNAMKNSKYNFVLDSNYIDELLSQSNSVFDTTGHSEKPDVVASRIMEGRVAIIVDGTPNVTTVPYFFIESFQAPDDYYINKYYAGISRCLRWFAFFIATLLTAIYIALSTYHFSLIPTVFVFRLSVSRAGVPFPTVIEVLLMFTFFQLIKEAGIRLPQPIGQAMSIVGALILGDAAVGAGITSQSTVLIVSLSSICYFLIPKIYGGVSIWSFIIIIMSSLNGLPGFYIGFFMLVTNLSSLKTAGYPYMFPFSTYEKKNLKDAAARDSLEDISIRVVKENEEK